MHVKSQHSLNRHVKRVHQRRREHSGGEPGRHECRECGKRFFEREDLTKHLARHAKQGSMMQTFDLMQIQNDLKVHQP